MSNIFTLENIEDFSEKLNIDDLYEKKRQHDLNKLVLFNKILNRIHVKIKTISRQKIDEQFCWFVVPEIIIGVPKYDQGACIAYVIDKLKNNGFNVKYIHPNTLFISWLHWVPSYVRTEIKKKTGVVINEYGVKIEDQADDYSNHLNVHKPKISNDPYDIHGNNTLILNPNPRSTSTKEIKQPSLNKKLYTPINSYKPSGNLVYNNDLLSKLEDKINLL